MKKADFDGIMRGLKETAAFVMGDAAHVRVHVPAMIDVVSIRAKSGLSQAKFADRVGVRPATLRNWEQGRRVPDGPARVLLAMLARNPQVVEETLARSSGSISSRRLIRPKPARPSGRSRSDAAA